MYVQVYENSALSKTELSKSSEHVQTGQVPYAVSISPLMIGQTRTRDESGRIAYRIEAEYRDRVSPPVHTNDHDNRRQYRYDDRIDKMIHIMR